MTGFRATGAGISGMGIRTPRAKTQYAVSEMAPERVNDYWAMNFGLTLILEILKNFSTLDVKRF